MKEKTETENKVNVRFNVPVRYKNGRSRSLVAREITSYFKEFPDIMTPREVATALHASKDTVYQLIKDGRIAAIRIGRCFKVPKVALVEFMVNERNYFILSPNVSDNLWTSRKSCGICVVADEHTDKVATTNNQKSQKKGA